MFFLWGFLALTAPERKAVQQALDKVTQAQSDYSRAKAETATAWEYAGNADAHAADTDAKIAPLQAQIDASHANEQKLADRLAKVEPFYLRAHKLWGIMGIILCFGILAGHILILVGFVILLLVAFWALSLAFPALGPIVSIGTGFFKRLFDKIFKRKQQ